MTKLGKVSIETMLPKKTSLESDMRTPRFPND